MRGRDELSRPNSLGLLPAGRGEVVGFCSLDFRKRLNYTTPEAWVPDLVVSEKLRRTGIGKALLEHAEHRAIERNCWALSLESAHHRVEAHRFYAALGFRATHEGYKLEL